MRPATSFSHGYRETVTRLRFALPGGAALLIGATVAIIFWPSSKSSSATPPTTSLANGRVVYRRACGQCHELADARSAGFGGSAKADGGPSFDHLDVSYDVSVGAITGSFTGHETLMTDLSWQEIQDVSAYLANATRGNPIVAKLIDG